MSRAVPAVVEEHVELPCEARSAAAARRVVASACARAALPADTCDTAQLLVSELVTNAVLHGRSDVRLDVRVETPPGPAHLLVGVGDENSRVPVPQPDDADALDGRGLALVAALAERWGVREEPFGKTVWFDLAASD